MFRIRDTLSERPYLTYVVKRQNIFSEYFRALLFWIKDDVRIAMPFLSDEKV